MTMQSPSRRHFLQASGAGLCALATGTGAFAQAAPEQLRILVGFPAGSVPDSVARLVGEQLAGSYARRALVDNRPGAAGMIAIAALKAAPADGSTVLLGPGTLASANPYLYEKLAYDPTADLQPVSLGAEVVLGLAVGPAVPASVGSVRDLLDWLRANPQLANLGSPGVGTPPHLVEAMLMRKAGIAWQHVGYAGGPPALNALLGGQIAAVMLPEGLLRQQLATGKLRVLATSAAQRTATLPEVPTFAEQGHPELVVTDWFAFFMPRGSDTVAVEATSRKLRTALAQPGLVAAYAQAGIVAASSTPGVLATRIAAERRYWEPVIRDNHIRLD